MPGNEPHGVDIVAVWFDNLLPESATISQRLRQRFGTASTNALDLLTAIGRDCVAAVQLTPSRTPPPDGRRVDADPITNSQVASRLGGVTATGPLGIDEHPDEFRISIGGAQEKTALLRLRVRWHVSSGSTPTTPILKLPLGLVGHIRAHLRDSVENEWLCMHLLGELGLPVPRAENGRFSDDVGDEKASIVERFDRTIATVSGSRRKWITRLPQEDFCQALGIPATRKYEAGVSTRLARFAWRASPRIFRVLGGPSASVRCPLLSTLTRMRSSCVARQK